MAQAIQALRNKQLGLRKPADSAVFRGRHYSAGRSCQGMPPILQRRAWAQLSVFPVEMENELVAHVKQMETMLS